MDTVDRATRSRVMSRIRARGNRSTETRLRAHLASSGVRGWRMHDTSVVGRPDFSFGDSRLAVFVDGCFWHLCPTCGRAPRSRLSYWLPKLERNRRRDRLVVGRLRRLGWRVLRLWEHEIGADPLRALARVRAALARAS